MNMSNIETEIPTTADFSEAHKHMARLYFKIGEVVAASKLFENALSFEPNDQEGVYECAKAYLHLNNHNKAQSICNNYLDRNPDDTLIKKVLSEIQTADSFKLDSTKAKKVFGISCPHCNTGLNISRTGKWQCPVCKNDFDYDGENITPL